ncbi:MAG: glutamyl-tRNA reductase [bacterium]|nr:glutamyl-tRNA reductase [bacterium]
MNSLKVIAFTHKSLPLELIGKLHLTQEDQSFILPELKVRFGFTELMFLSTCNRIELLLTSATEINETLVADIALFLNKTLSTEEAQILAQTAAVHQGKLAVEHMLRVASSLDSMVVGEREIITQVRKSYDFSHALGLTGDFLRLLIKQTIITAKEIYTDTDIAKNPVSVASLAYRQLRHLGIKNDARIVFVGSGETNTVLASYFQKHEFSNFTVFNRTQAHAEKLAAILHGKAIDLASIMNFEGGFDVLVVCTSSSQSLITPQVYESLLRNETSKKVIIDLSLPANVDEAVSKNKQVHYIDINSLRAQAEANLQLRRNEIVKCEEIISTKASDFDSLYAERKIELAFGEVPKQVKAIKDLAVNEIFAKEIDLLDLHSKEVLEKVLTYMEKKYNAVAIKTAKEVFLSNK